MNLSLMISEIIRIIDLKYNFDEECLDICQIKRFCKLYKSKNTQNNPRTNVSSLDITFSSPDATKKIKSKKNKRSSELNINTPEFQKVYGLFIKILYACLKLEVEIFDTDSNDLVTIKNNYQLIKSIEMSKKKYTSDHIEFLKAIQKKAPTTDLRPYENYVAEYIAKMKILNKLVGRINTFGKNDNLFSLILPYFYTYTEYIEEYVG
jgi:hypothetical protein